MHIDNVIFLILSKNAYTKFSEGPDAQKWGNAMYKDGNYKVISGTFNSSVTASPGVIYYPRLDGIGPAYLIPLAALNNSIINICCI